ncbi:hypothetical protein [Lacticaseibacillus camelliae]|uniref:Uncharacterized protein n=1 Tax=Lacticaseibacillus camelliae DSM 22697 = JCM 13995 TaxID=1423730 RepID=A0A0R2F0Y8_9LACO|nr:hypothetical protein [Lacticaseibacillus camelliae]KRN22216.1 hypothetical protein FC75_GL001852 [Lacticaseibacillus camelliae DSM 22697 = JCM 13995]
MSLFKKKQPDTPQLPQSYDFAKMVKNAREQDPSRFAKLQATFGHLKKTPHHHQEGER